MKKDGVLTVRIILFYHSLIFFIPFSSGAIKIALTPQEKKEMLMDKLYQKQKTVSKEKRKEKDPNTEKDREDSPDRDTKDISQV